MLEGNASSMHNWDKLTSYKKKNLFMDALTRASLINSIVQEAGLPRPQATLFLEKMLEAMACSLADHNNVKPPEVGPDYVS